MSDYSLDMATEFGVPFYWDGSKAVDILDGVHGPDSVYTSDGLRLDSYDSEWTPVSNTYGREVFEPSEIFISGSSLMFNSTYVVVEVLLLKDSESPDDGWCAEDDDSEVIGWSLLRRAERE